MDPQKSGMKYGVFEGISASMMFGITSTYLTVFALAMGADTITIGLVVAVPTIFSMLGYIPAALLIEGSGNRKKYCVLTSLIGRGSWLLVAIIPLFATGRLVWLLVFVCISSLLESLIGPAWASLMGDMIPESHRGRYFGRRNMLCKVASLIATTAAGVILDLYTGLGGFTIIFAASGVCGLLTALFFSRFHEPRAGIGRHVNLSMGLKDITRNRMFKRFLLIMCVWQLGFQISSPFNNVYLVEGIGAGYQWISIITLASGIAAILVQRGWGTMADRFGQRSILTIGIFGASFVPFFWMFVTTPGLAIPVNILSGISHAALDMASFNYLLEATRGKERALYSALYWSILDVSAIIGPIIGGVLAQTYLGGLFLFNGFTFVFFVSWLIRLSAAILLLKLLLELPDRRAYPTGYVAGELFVAGLAGSFHLIKETGSLPVRIMDKVERVVKRTVWIVRG